jgi:hypothetical protein
MGFRRVRAGGWYIYQPVLLDQTDPPYGVKAGLIRPGAPVKVVKLPGCPLPNTMGHAHIENQAGEFAGLVCTNSLQPRKEVP